MKICILTLGIPKLQQWRSHQYGEIWRPPYLTDGKQPRTSYFLRAAMAASLRCRGLLGQTSTRRPRGIEFFYFYIFFVHLSKIYVAIFFFQKCHPAAGWFGGKELPPDEPAVRSLAHGPWKLPPDQTAVAPYRQTNRR